MKKTILTIILLAFAVGIARGEAPGDVVTFRFVPGDDMFYIPWEGNDKELDRLYSLVDRYRGEIKSGTMPVYVDGYSPTKQLSFIRANRVKSELILHKGLIEENFITKNYATAYTGPDGTVYKNIVVVTMKIPAQPEPRPEPQPEPIVEKQPDPDPVIKPQPEPVVEPEPIPEQAPEASWFHTEPYRLAVRTNLLYDAFLLPTLGVEWRVSRHVGVKLDGSRSWWSGGDRGRVQKIWLLSPEVRWYLLDAKRLYVGAGVNFGRANIYRGLTSVLSSDTGYQGKIAGGGVTVGYQVALGGDFSLDFNLGLGVTHFNYDTFTVTGGERVYRGRNISKNFWGPSQAGVNLVWTIGSK